MQLPPGGITVPAPHAGSAVNSLDDTLRVAIVSGPLPSFFTVSGRGALVTPTATTPKSIFVGGAQT